MRIVKQSTVIIASLLVYLATLALTYRLGDYRPSVSGLLIVILLSAFARGWLATLLVGIGSMFTMTMLILLIDGDGLPITQAILSQLYALLILGLTMGLVLYLKKIQQNYDNEKTHLASLFENTTEGILLTNRKGLIILANPAAERIFGYTASELVGRSVDFLLPDRSQGHHPQLREKFHHQPTNRRMGTGRDLFAKRKDGSEFPVEVSLSHYHREEQVFVIAFIVDITERKRAVQELEEQQQELKKVNERIQGLNVELEFKVEERTRGLQDALHQVEISQAEMKQLLERERELSEIKSRFVSLASHEFRTPLTSILTSATLASSYSKQDQVELREKHLNRIEESVVFLNGLLHDFLSLGKIEEGKLTVEIGEFNLNEFLTDLVEEMNIQLQAGQRIQVKLTGSHTFSTDKRLLKNILINLISNAIKFSFSNSVIELNLQDTPTGKSIAVKDYGMGIPPEDLPHLFSNFSRGSNVNQIQGTGLGLTLVKRYADILKGTVTLHSELGKGTVVTLEIPNLKVP